MGNKCQYSEYPRKAHNTLILELGTDIQQDDISQIIPPSPIKPKFLHEESDIKKQIPTINVVRAQESSQMESTKKCSFQADSIGDLLITQQAKKGIIKQNLNQRRAISQKNVRNVHFSISEEQKAETKSENVIKLSNLLAKKQQFYPLVSVFQGNQ